MKKIEPNLAGMHLSRITGESNEININKTANEKKSNAVFYYLSEKG